MTRTPLDYVVVIPARFASTRFPGKPLQDILGKSMLQRTYDQCAKVIELDKIWIATDSELIVDHCNEHGMNVMMTSSDCLTGTDRVIEFAQKVNAYYYINVQGDEPVFNPDDLLKLVDRIKGYPKSSLSAVVDNGYTKIDNAEDYNSSEVPKVVFNNRNELMYMSRAPIPGNKNGTFEKAYRQVCLYTFSWGVLSMLNMQKGKTQFEEIEDIEILRFLEKGIEVNMIEMSNLSQPVDNPEDLIKVEKIIKERNL